MSYTVNKTPIEKYSIVYASAGEAGKNNLDNANLLKDAIEKKTGAALSVVSDTEYDASGKAVYVGSSFAKLPENTPCLACDIMNSVRLVSDGNVFLAGGGLLTDYLAVKNFVDDFFSEDAAAEDIVVEDVRKSFIDVPSAPKTEGAEFRAMTYNILAEYPSWGTYLTVEMRSEAFKAVMDIYSPDVVGIQEVSETWYKEIPRMYEGKYTFVYPNTPDGQFINMSTIWYKNEKFDLVDSGLQYFSYRGPNKIRLVTWAILKDKETDKKIAFFNTHWMFFRPGDEERRSHSVENAVIINKVMADHPDVAYAFSTADYNTKLDHEFIANFIRDAHLVNSRDLAREAGTLKNDAGGCTKPGTDRRVTSGGPIDHIFVTDNMQILAYETILWNGVEHVSDHSPKYADIVLGK